MLEYWYFLTFDKIILAIFWQNFENFFDHYRKNDESWSNPKYKKFGNGFSMEVDFRNRFFNGREVKTIGVVPKETGKMELISVFSRFFLGWWKNQLARDSKYSSSCQRRVVFLVCFSLGNSPWRMKTGVSNCFLQNISWKVSTKSCWLWLWIIYSFRMESRCLSQICHDWLWQCRNNQSWRSISK